MSEIKVYNISNSVKELNSIPYQLEVQLQRMIETNMKVFFSVDFLESEYIFNGGRIDSLAIDENNCPVIFEYKRNINENVINQGLYYLEWLLDHKADFELLVLKKFGQKRAEQIEWKSPIVYCIANKFTKYDVNAVKQMQRNIYLVEYKRFDNDILVFDYLNLDLKINEIKDVGGVQPGVQPIKPIKTMDERVESLNNSMREIFDEIVTYINSLGDDVTEVYLKHYIAFKKVSNFVTLEVFSAKIQIYLKLHAEKLENEINQNPNMRDVTHIGHYGTGDVELIIRTKEELEFAKNFIQRAYDEN